MQGRLQDFGASCQQTLQFPYHSQSIIINTLLHRRIQSSCSRHIYCQIVLGARKNNINSHSFLGAPNPLIDPHQYTWGPRIDALIDDK
jgi:hypothetical protein